MSTQVMAVIILALIVFGVCHTNWVDRKYGKNK